LRPTPSGAVWHKPSSPKGPPSSRSWYPPRQWAQGGPYDREAEDWRGAEGMAGRALGGGEGRQEEDQDEGGRGLEGARRGWPDEPWEVATGGKLRSPAACRFGRERGDKLRSPAACRFGRESTP
jgi:hypothetical protein